MTTAEINAAARRLGLPSYARMTVRQAEEARTCIGCTGRYEHGIYLVRAVPGCPAHGAPLGKERQC